MENQEEVRQRRLVLEAAIEEESIRSAAIFDQVEREEDQSMSLRAALTNSTNAQCKFTQPSIENQIKMKNLAQPCICQEREI